MLWHYRKEGLPLRVEAEFGVWRKVVDHDGATGWMHHSVVSLKRMALVTASSARIHAEPDDATALVAVAERNALLELQACPTQWCRVNAGDIRAGYREPPCGASSRAKSSTDELLKEKRRRVRVAAPY